MKRSGYIEGYFGKTLTWNERSGLLDHLSDLGMNTYLLAPKEDPYHRVKWKIAYPEEEKQNIKNMVLRGSSLGVDVVPSMGPGLSYDYLSDDDYNVLLDKVTDFFSMNIYTVGLLMDDISPELPDNCKDSFTSLGEAHGKLLVKLYADLRKRNSKAELWFCPTIYTDQFADGNALESDYIKDLALLIPRDIPIFWTGPRVVSENITRENCGNLYDLFHGNVIVWDNYYANDYCPFKIFMGAFLGRDHELLAQGQGVLLNPTGLYHTDKMLLSLMADYLKTGKSGGESWEMIAEQYQIHPMLKQYRRFFSSPFTSFNSEDFHSLTLVNPADFYENVIVKWDSPLRLEWYSYLYGFYLDIQIAQQKGNMDQSWFYNRYPAFIANRLIHNY